MKSIYCCIFALLACAATAQDTGTSNEPKPNAIYVELFGNGILYSINYDRLLSTNGNLKISARVGFSYVDIDLFDEIKGTVIPIEFLGWMGNKRHLEFGVGLSSQFVEVKDVSILGPTQQVTSNAYYLTGRVGYRRQKPDGGFVFRAGFVPMFLLSESNSDASSRSEFVPWFGLSFGYAF